MFTKAIVRKPCSNLIDGLTEVNLGTPDYHKAMIQHSRYVDVLRNLNLDVTILEADNRFPDSVFVEDAALCFPGFAVITRPGAMSRRDEITLIEEPIQSTFDEIHRIESPGTLDGGDVMIANKEVFIGLSDRTNSSGADQLINIVEDHGLSGVKVPLKEMLHLKTGVSYLENNTLLACGEFIHHPIFSAFNKIEVSPDEAYAANSLWINGNVLVPAGHPQTKQKIEDAGYLTIEVEMSEFQKLDGGLSCLSLRF